MVQHNIYLQSTQSPYFVFEENPIPLGRSKVKQLQEISRQCFAIARLSAEDWQHIGTAISPIVTGSVRQRVHHQFLPSPRLLQQVAIAVSQCLKLFALQNEDWQNMTNLLSRY